MSNNVVAALYIKHISGEKGGVWLLVGYKDISNGLRTYRLVYEAARL